MLFRITTILLFAIQIANAQQENLRLNKDITLSYEKYLNDYDKKTFHTAVKPYNAAKVYEMVYPDTIQNYERINKSGFIHKVINVVGFENLLEFDEHGYIKHHKEVKDESGAEYHDISFDKSYNKRKVYITLNPILDIGVGYDFYLGKSIIHNTKGIEMRADIGQRITLYTSFQNTVAKVPSYVYLYRNTTQAVPGEGKSRPAPVGKLDYSNTVAYFAYSPNKYFNMQIGHGKHFIGDGYRSLLLSDNAFYYPYLQFTTSFWKIQYTNIFAEFENKVEGEATFATGFGRKLATFNYLSVDAAKWLQLGLFEGMMWRRSTANGNTAFDYNFLNPLIGVRGLQKNLDINKLYGLNAKITLPKYITIYGQYAINHFGKKNTIDNRTAYQIGAKYLDVAGIKNLNIQVEYNVARPYMYQGNDSALAYSHYNQSITHPMGANFREILFLANYQYKRFYTAYKFSYTNAGTEITRNKNYGNNVLEALQDATTTTNIKSINGEKYRIMDNEIRFGYIINPKINLILEAKMQFRNYSFSRQNTFNSNLNAVGFNFKTNIFNKYYDLPILF